MKVYELIHPKSKRWRGIVMLADDVTIEPADAEKIITEAQECRPNAPHFLELKDAEGWFAVIRDAEMREMQTIQSLRYEH